MRRRLIIAKRLRANRTIARRAAATRKAGVKVENRNSKFCLMSSGLTDPFFG